MGRIWGLDGCPGSPQEAFPQILDEQEHTRDMSHAQTTPGGLPKTIFGSCISCLSNWTGEEMD
jgi:hypothetical protein